MSLKKKAEVRTGKMVRELMLADEEVTASLIMVYSNNGVNEEIKVEGLNPKTNEELFLSGKVDWNNSVIYKIVDFSGKAEVGKATLTAMKSNNVTLEIERVMWSKENKEETAASEIEQADKIETPPAPQAAKEENKLALVHKKVPAKEEKQEMAAEELPPTSPRALPAKREDGAAAAKTTSASAAVQNTYIHENYNRLVQKAKFVCQDYELGMDIDDSVEALKEELTKQGVSLEFGSDIMDIVGRLRALQDKGVNVQKVLNLL